MHPPLRQPPQPPNHVKKIKIKIPGYSREYYYTAVVLYHRYCLPALYILYGRYYVGRLLDLVFYRFILLFILSVSLLSWHCIFYTVVTGLELSMIFYYSIILLEPNVMCILVYRYCTFYSIDTVSQVYNYTGIILYYMIWYHHRALYYFLFILSVSNRTNGKEVWSVVTSFHYFQVSLEPATISNSSINNTVMFLPPPHPHLPSLPPHISKSKTYIVYFIYSRQCQRLGRCCWLYIHTWYSSTILVCFFVSTNLLLDIQMYIPVDTSSSTASSTWHHGMFT